MRSDRAEKQFGQEMIVNGPNMKMRVGVVLVMVMVLGGCEREEQDSIEEPPGELDRPVELPERPAQKEVEPDAMDERDQGEEGEEVLFTTWPGRDEHRQVELMWLGGDSEVALFEDPDQESEQVGTMGWEDGEDLIWRESRVRVVEPRELTVESEVTWPGIPYDVEYGELEAEPKEFQLQPGEMIYLYQYDGEGTCYLKVQREIALGDCPNGGALKVDEEVEEFLPEVQEWWIQVSTEEGEGWILVDEAPLEVRILEMSAPHPEMDYGADEF